jgi:hypothetical protein
MDQKKEISQKEQEEIDMVADRAAIARTRDRIGAKEAVDNVLRYFNKSTSRKRGGLRYKVLLALLDRANIVNEKNTALRRERRECDAQVVEKEVEKVVQPPPPSVAPPVPSAPPHTSPFLFPPPPRVW